MCLLRGFSRKNVEKETNFDSLLKKSLILSLCNFIITIIMIRIMDYIIVNYKIVKKYCGVKTFSTQYFTRAYTEALGTRLLISMLINMYTVLCVWKRVGLLFLVKTNLRGNRQGLLKDK